MLFLYGELMVLLLVAFSLGAAVAALVMRTLVKELPPELAGVVEPRAEADAGGGTP